MNPQTPDVYVDMRPSCVIDPEHPQADRGMQRRHAFRVRVMRDSHKRSVKTCTDANNKMPHYLNHEKLSRQVF